jgi:putative spermidine/putrescine transport system ATP-binding protein
MFGLEVRGVSKAYGTQRAVDDVSLAVPHGQFVCFLGPSGCGKTTLLRLIAGLEPAGGGAILLNGRDITHQPANVRKFGMVFQSLALFPHLTVAENIAFSLRLQGRGARERMQRVDELLELVRLPDMGRRAVSQLSGGQRQRVAIARALAQEPPVFLLDEPFSALDAKLREDMQVELRQLQRRLKITTILVTHDQREAMSMADAIAVMADGKIQQYGGPLSIYRNPANRFVANFVGLSNLLPVEVLDCQTVRFGANILKVPQTPDSFVSHPATLSIRPEDIQITAANAPDENTVSGRITLVRDLGSCVEVHLDCNGRDVLSVVQPRDWTGAGAGDLARLRLPQNQCRVLAA